MMIDEGLIIMGVGMLVVFTFLAIMVLSMGFMSNLILRFFPENEKPISISRKRTAAALVTTVVTDDSELAIAVAAAHSIGTYNSELAAAIAVAHSL